VEYFVITDAAINDLTNFDGSEIILEIDFITDLVTRTRFTISYSGSLLNLNPDCIFEDLHYFLDVCNQKIPLNERNTTLRNHDNVLGKILVSNHILERKMIKDLFKMD
jgi:hypothetical protein